MAARTLPVLHKPTGSPFPNGYRSDALPDPWAPGEVRELKVKTARYLVRTFPDAFEPAPDAAPDPEGFVLADGGPAPDGFEHVIVDPEELAAAGEGILTPVGAEALGGVNVDTSAPAPEAAPETEGA